jgi:hypothetical protein
LRIAALIVKIAVVQEASSMALICTTPIQGPKAWRGADLVNDTSWIVTLTEAEIADIAR